MNLKPQENRFTACHRHPAQPVTGFCALCLRERLSGLDPTGDVQNSPTLSSYLPELRRCKTYASNRREGCLSRSVEPQRKSCDVRVVRNTLCSLFDLDDGGRNGDSELESKNLGLSEVIGTVVEVNEEEIDKEEIRVFHDTVDLVEDEGELKTMKEFIDLECRNRKQSSMDLKILTGSILTAAKKLRKWSRKQTTKTPNITCADPDSAQTQEQKANVSHHFTNTQPEIGDYGFGRRSCDTDPRFSIDGGRYSLDCPRYSFDEPRSSWDGYLVGRTIPRLAPMFSVDEDEDTAAVQQQTEEKEMLPGGTAQTRDYYTDSSRRRSFDQLGLYEMKAISNAKVSPTTGELFHGAKVLFTDRDLNTKSPKNEFLERNGDRKGSKNGWRKTWSIWNLLNKRNIESKNENLGNESPVASCVKTSSSSVSSTSSCKLGGGRATRYSPNNLDNGLLRFYLTPLRSTRSRHGNSRLKNSPSIAKNFLPFY